MRIEEMALRRECLIRRARFLRALAGYQSPLSAPVKGTGFSAVLVPYTLPSAICKPCCEMQRSLRFASLSIFIVRVWFEGFQIMK